MAKPPTMKNILKRLRMFCAPVNTTPKLMDLIRTYLQTEIKENKLSHATEKKYDAICNNIESFMLLSRQADIRADEVRIKFVADLKNYLHTSLKSCCLTHAAKHIETVKRALDYAVNQEMIKYNPIKSYKSKRDRTKDVVSLDAQEIEKLKKSLFVSEVYNTVRNFYLFQCYTGLSYMDLWRYQVVSDDGMTWVTCDQGRGKTKKKYWSELTKEAAEIHNFYNGEFPHLENATYNRIIKEVMAQIGVKKHITTHTGRKTFATIKDQEGYSTGTIAAMLGNTEEIARRHYIDPTKTRVKNEILKLKQTGSMNMLNSQLS